MAVTVRVPDDALCAAWAEDNKEFEDALTGAKLDGDTALWVRASCRQGRLSCSLQVCTFAQYQAKKNDTIVDIGPTVAEQLAIDPFSRVIESEGVKNGLGLIAVHTTTADLYGRYAARCVGLVCHIVCAGCGARSR